MKYALIVSGRVHSTPEYEALPVFAPNIILIELPEASPVAAGWLYADGQFMPPAPTEPPMAERLRENNAAYEAATGQLTADYPQLEKDTWPTQDQEASAWLQDPLGAQTPWVDRAAQVRGLDREEYLRRTLVKARQFVIMSAWLTGRRQGYEDAIKGGGAPALDYQLPQEVLLELQAIQQTVMTAPTAQLREELA